MLMPAIAHPTGFFSRHGGIRMTAFIYLPSDL